MPHTLAQLEAFVSSPHYDSATAGLIALGIPELPRFKGEQIAPGITRIRGNLCNVHGRYGPCDKAASGKKKPAKGRAARKPAKAKPTDAQRSAERDTKRSQNAASVAQRMAESDTGLAPQASKNLLAFATGQQPDAMGGAGLASLGLAERASDGSYRMTPTGRAVVSAMQAGDYQRAVDAISRGTDAQGKRSERTTAQQARQQAAAKRQADVQAKRQAAQAKREAAVKKPAKSASGGSKKPEKPAIEKPRKAAPAKRRARSSAPSVGSVSSAAPKKKPVKQPVVKPEKAPVKQIAPALQESVQALSDGKELSEDDTQSLIRNGLAKLDKSGMLILTAAGMRATQKQYSFQVFKDASGRYRWVAQSSTAFQDRDKEIVSTKALADDCAFADATGSYGPLRWWHAPGLDLGDCDFNAMHGRVLIESGTFRTPAIAHKVAAAADGLEISLGFLHLPTEPDASGVFHHIRRFERSLVPRGKASNRFTAFAVKETLMLDTTKVAALKTLGFSDDDIAGLQAQAAATEKAADAQQIAYKADEPVELPDVVINGVTYKAMPPMIEAAATEEVAETDAIEDMPMEEAEAEGGLTLSPEDIAAIGSAVAEQIGPAIAQVMGALDLEKKVAGHVQGLLAPYQATKDASDAEKADAITALQTSLKAAEQQQAALKAQLDELLGLQPAVKAERPSESTTTTINPWVPTDQQLMESIKHQVSPNDQFAFGDLVENLFGTQTPGQA